MGLSKIYGDVRFLRGNEATIPTFAEGQPGFTKDTKRVFIGSDSGNVELAKQDDVNGLVQRVNGHDEDISTINTQLVDNTSKIGIYGRKAVYVESYDNLKIAVMSGYDYSPCIQAAHDAAAANSAAVIYPSGQVLQVSQPIRLKNQNGNYIFGNRCVLKRIGLAATSDTPIMYYMGLTDIGGTTKSYNYNSGVYLFDFKFMSDSGFGVGYKHAIAGELYVNNCIFDSSLEVGTVLSGTNGCHFYNCQIAGKNKGIFCARVAEDSYTVNYTSEGTGWNDGIYVIGGMITCSANGYGFYYSGTFNEGVIKIQNVKIIGALNATGVYARSFTNLIIDGGWCEYFNGGKVFHADADSTAANYEPDLFVIRNFQFTHRTGYKADYSIYSRAVRTFVEDCQFLNNANQQHIYYSSGTSNTLRIALSLQPTVIDTTFGTITFPKTNIPDTRDLIITDGTNQYYLVFNADMGANGYKYNTYTYTTPTKRSKWWIWGTYTDSYNVTRITNPTLSLSTTYTINSIDDSAGLCEVVRPVFHGLSSRANAVGWGGFGVVLVKDPMPRT